MLRCFCLLCCLSKLQHFLVSLEEGRGSRVKQLDDLLDLFPRVILELFLRR